ncbi:MAG: gliding motility-associated C-terminal domain-containing protein [Saprospiraceae bacterium]|nr:gliding motility-associated C-terminal domain-containing protein [Saprospiraceae bacterium]
MAKIINLSFCLLAFCTVLKAQVYTVNNNSDTDDGTCDGVHCSFREALNAAEADGMPSTIVFNIPGAGPHIISPVSNFPVIANPNLSILGESQPGGPGSVVIDFNFRNFFGIPFLAVQAGAVAISGLSFTDFRFENPGDCILDYNNAPDCTLRACAFLSDNNLLPVPEKVFIRIRNADQFKMVSSHIGTDLAKSSIPQTEGKLKIEATQGMQTVTLDSNIFTAKVPLVEIYAGDVFINYNLFGALDTNKGLNFLDPTIGILAPSAERLLIHDNFFFGFLNAAIDISNLKQTSVISKNRFYNDNQDITISNSNQGLAFIVDNFARNGSDFVNAADLSEFYVERNSINNYDVFINANTPSAFQISRYMDNRFTCISGQPVFMPPRPVPSIVAVNRDMLTGTAIPNDSVVIYARSTLLCLNDDCHGGFELGRTQADAVGNWTLNAAYPNRHQLSAYEFDSNPNSRPRIHSEFGNCYVCVAPIRIVFAPSLCSGQTVTYRGKVYSDTNPNDSIFIRGDGVSICDSTIIVDVQVANAYRQVLNLAVCYEDTLTFGAIQIHKNNLVDSLNTKTANGCDSTVVYIGREVGVSNYSRTICDNAFVDIGGTRFDKNNTSGIAIIAGGAQAGCDSVIFVQLNINNFSESFLKENKCPGDVVVIQGTVFNESNPKGDVTLPNGSSTGCDSIIHVDLTYPNNRGLFSTTICMGDSVFVVNRFFSDRNPSGTITLPGGSSFGCDSIIDVALNILQNAQGFFTADICRGDTLFIHGEAFFSGRPSGIVRLVNSAANGCDSLVNVNTNTIMDAIGNFDTIMCDGASVTYYGQTFSNSRPRGSFRIPMGSFRMCDSFVNVNVLFNPNVFSNYSTTICRGDSIRVGNSFFSVNNPSGSVILSGGSAQGCDSTILVNVLFNPPLQISLNPLDLKCNRPNSGELVINSISGGSGSYQVSVDNGAPISGNPGMIITGLSVGNHNIRVIDQLGCDSIFNFSISGSQILQLNLPGDTTIKTGGVVNIIPTLNFNYSNLVWDPKDFLSCDTCLVTQSRPNQTITYTLTVNDQNGCSISDQFTITVIIDAAEIYVPNVFSPNGDNINDTFKPVFKFESKTSIRVFRIFDRWGSLLFEQLNGAPGQIFEWDGTYQKDKMIPGVYMYTILFAGEDNIEKWKAGDITLMR